MKMQKIQFLLALWFISLQVEAQVIYGTNNYTQYHIGTLPIIISAPHGGLIAPSGIPNRTCNSPTYDLDSRTIELTRQIDTALFNLTGCRPHLIICNLRRTKVDCNRNIADGACGNVDAINAWTDFHDFIDTAQYIAQNQYGGKALYIDLHGHGKQPYRLELGYGLSGGAFNQTDAVLNNAFYLNASSIKQLVNTNVSGSTHAQLLRGPNALGTYFANAGFPAVPSQQSPNTGGFPYFSGGYNTFNYTCIAANNTVNGLQIECDSTVRFGYSNRKKFADSTASVLVKYFLVHQNLNLQTNCGLGILPIELVVFSGIAMDKKNVLFWKTSSEINNDYFTLLKSVDGVNFEPIAKINGAGNSTQLINYTFEDTDLTETRNYYKLTQTDYDGLSRFSQMIEINNSSDEILIFPNPATGFIQFSMANLGNDYEVSLTNTLGEIVLKAKNKYKLSIPNLPKGIYFVKIISEQTYIYNRKIIIQ